MVMKKFVSWRFVALFLAVVFSTACFEGVFHSQYTLVLPRPPEAWVSILGEPHWRVEWLAPNGSKKFQDIAPSQRLEFELPQTWINAVTAWPYWPALGIGPGLFRPCGAIFPYDTVGSRIYLSWQAGIDAVFYWELVNAYRQNASTSRVPRLPQYFDWLRFRELFQTDVLRQEMRDDPWLAAWPSIAERTVSSGFDRRRLVPEAVVQRPIPVPHGVWHGSSPFSRPLVFEEGQPPVFPARALTEVWISSEGILRSNNSAWSFTPFE
ncbi:MAG: hypothetical protein FWG66_13110 [Spirochaetes bacterium]|nr:hypothetical protein [Spirochaetota bacterium]